MSHMSSLADHGPRSRAPGKVVESAAREPAGSGSDISEPSLSELTEALTKRVDEEGAVPVGIAERLKEEEGWAGRLLEVLGVVTQDSQTMGYLAGGRRPDEVATWLSAWVESPLSLEEIRLVVAAGGWDPEPFVVLARAGLLGTLLRRADGSPRRIRGELAGGWVSDQLALDADADILQRVRQVLESDEGSPGSPGGT
jgi:hypothetical protein